MQTELEYMVNSTKGKLTFSTLQIDFMLNNIGNTDSHLRDDVIYTLFARGFIENGFTNQQQKLIAQKFIQANNLFQDINQPQGDAIFLRSFSALLGNLILTKDTQEKFLTSKQQNLLFNWSIQYLTQEKDYRGFVQSKGWAHAIAHGSDFLAATLSHPNFKPQNLQEILQIIPNILASLTQPLVDDEEERLANAFAQGIKNNKIALINFVNLIKSVSEALKSNLNSQKQVDYWRLSSWIKMLHTWLFLIPEQPIIQQTLIQEIKKYYHKMGYKL